MSKKEEQQEIGVAIETDGAEKRKSRRFWSKWCRNGFRFWCRKYFWEGQLRHGDVSGECSREDVKSPFSDVSPTKRKLLSMAIPAVILHFAWWSVMIKKDLWGLFVDKYFMTITMVFASIIAGMTSEGGGAVAFPVMTLAFGVKPAIARDFSVMIQSFGMTAAAFTIFFMKVQIEYTALIWCSIGGVIGCVIGLELIDPRLTPPMKKMGFVSIWFAFAFSLFLLNWKHKRRIVHRIQDVKYWKICVLLVTGIMGGIFTSFAGSGLDICSFSMITLLFRVSEKVATPTSVILMAGNTLVVFFWRGLVINGISTDAWEYLMVCIPVVVIGAPVGSFLGSHFHRLILASFIYVIDTVALISAFAIIPQTPALAGSSTAIIVAGFIFFYLITKAGEKMLDLHEQDMQALECTENGVKMEKSLPVGDTKPHVNGDVGRKHQDSDHHGNVSKQTNGHVNQAYMDTENSTNM